MNILLFDNDPQERLAIQQALAGSAHTLVLADTADEAWRLIEAGGVRLLVMTQDAARPDGPDLVGLIRATKLAARLYILQILTGGEAGPPDTHTGPDDTLARPLDPAELRSRVTIASRMLDLEANLTEARDQLDHQVVLDPLTRFMNRVTIQRYARAELERARRQSAAFSLILLTLDNLAEISEKYGLPMQENLTRLAAQTIHARKRPYDGVGRWADEAFLVVLPGVEGADAESIAARFLHGVASINTGLSDLGGQPLTLRLSAGVACTHAGNANPGTLEGIFGQVEQAALRARQAGQNQVVLISL